MANMPPYLAITGVGVDESRVQKTVTDFPQSKDKRTSITPSDFSANLLVTTIRISSAPNSTIGLVDNSEALLKVVVLLPNEPEVGFRDKALEMVLGEVEGILSKMSVNDLVGHRESFLHIVAQRFQDEVRQNGLYLYKSGFVDRVKPEFIDENEAQAIDYMEYAGLTFNTWVELMDEYHRPYKCNVESCKDISSFTYGGDLLHHERVVHNMHGGINFRLPSYTWETNIGVTPIIPRRDYWSVNETTVPKDIETLNRVGWKVETQYLALPYDSSVHAAASQIQALWASLTDVLAFFIDIGRDVFYITGSAQQRLVANGSNLGWTYLKTSRGPCYQLRFSSVYRPFDPKTFTTIAALSLLPSAQAASTHISARGMPVTNTLAGALAWAIAAFGNRRTIGTAMYWTVYGCWGLAALLVLAFTASSIAKKYRFRYLGIFALVEVLILAAITASSIDDVEKMVERLEAWMPMATILVAGALPMAFKRVT